MSGGTYFPLRTSDNADEPSTNSPSSTFAWRAKSAETLHSLRKSKPVVVALGLITLATIFVGTRFTIGDGAFDFRTSAGQVVPESLDATAWEGNGISRKWGNVSDVSRFLMGPPANSIRDNLKPDFLYVTGWNAGGMSEFIALGKEL
ncbi:hypothetical protein FRB90_003843 [Tulasnella sp. 427]|nr:hypothetical protein FRB90_003843 [Tulasnella sp. 427]